MKTRASSLLSLAMLAHASSSPLLAQTLTCVGYETVNLLPDVQLSSAAMDGDVLVMGAPRDSTNGYHAGAARVFRYEATGWVAEQELFPSTFNSIESMGRSVAVSGDVIVVGSDSQNCTEAAYIYRFDGSTWLEEQRITPSVASFCNAFGTAVAISGDSIIVGARRDGHASVPGLAGSVFAYRFNGTRWLEEAIVRPADLASDAQFGHRVALEGDLAVIAAPSHFSGPPGAAYTFRRASGGAWSQEQKITASDGHADDSFGSALSLSGGHLAVGAYRHKVNGVIRGAAYVYRDINGVWGDEQQLIVENESNQLGLGYAIAVTDDNLVVGAPNQSAESPVSGSTHLYRRSGNQWGHEMELRPSDSTNGVYFGGALAAHERRLAVGVYRISSSSNGAYLYDLGALPSCPSTYCVGTLNSVGCVAAIGAHGSASVSSPGPFIITATNVITHKPGMLIYSFSPAATPFNGGILCVGQPFTRTPVYMSGGTLPAMYTCHGRLSFGMNDRIQNGGDVALTVGTTVYAQFLYRDRALQGARTPNAYQIGMTNALEFTINP